MIPAATYWTYKQSPIPELGDLPPGTFAGTAEEWNSLSPGYRRAIYRDAMRRKTVDTCQLT